MRIAYVTTYDAADVRHWSGTGHYIAKALEQQGIDVRYVGPLAERADWSIKAKRLYYKFVARKGYQRQREPAVLRSYADQVARALRQIPGVDAIFSPGTAPITYLKSDKPIVFWADATYAGMLGFYPGWSNLCRESVTKGNAMEQAALSNCRLAIYASDWAALTAKDHYRVDAAKVKVVPFGANLARERSLDDVRAIVRGRPRRPCRLLFLGVDWHRKGGDLAVAVVEELNRRGLPTELTVLGCTPPQGLPDCVTIKGFISKASPSGRDAIDAILAGSHFLLFPSRAECYGVAAAEACSFGVPVVASDVGGIPTAVRTGSNGITLPVAEYVPGACDFILRHMNDQAAYRDSAQRALAHYATRLNWRVAGEAVRRLLEAVCVRGPSTSALPRRAA